MHISIREHRHCLEKHNLKPKREELEKWCRVGISGEFPLHDAKLGPTCHETDEWLPQVSRLADRPTRGPDS